MPKYIWIPAEIRAFRKFLDLGRWKFALKLDDLFCSEFVIRTWETGRTKKISKRYQELLNKLASKTGYNPAQLTQNERR